MLTYILIDIIPYLGDIVDFMLSCIGMLLLFLIKAMTLVGQLIIVLVPIAVLVYILFFKKD